MVSLSTSTRDCANRRGATGVKMQGQSRLWLWWAMCVWKRGAWVCRWHSSRKRQPTLQTLQCQLLPKLSNTDFRIGERRQCEIKGSKMGAMASDRSPATMISTEAEKRARVSAAMLDQPAPRPLGQMCSHAMVVDTQRRGHWVMWIVCDHGSNN